MKKKKMERVKGIEPSSQAWEARILPLDHTRTEWWSFLPQPPARFNTFVGLFCVMKSSNIFQIEYIGR
jgi:hypothetical protein